MKLSKIIEGKFVNILLKSPESGAVPGYIVDASAEFLLVAQAVDGEVGAVVPMDNVATIVIEDEMEFLMESIDIKDQGDPH